MVEAPREPHRQSERRQGTVGGVARLAIHGALPSALAASPSGRAVVVTSMVVPAGTMAIARPTIGAIRTPIVGRIGTETGPTIGPTHGSANPRALARVLLRVALHAPLPSAASTEHARPVARGAKGGITIGRSTSKASGPSGPVLGKDGQERATGVLRQAAGLGPLGGVGRIARPATRLAPILPVGELVLASLRPPQGLEALRILARVHAAPLLARRVPLDGARGAIRTPGARPSRLSAQVLALVEAHAGAAMGASDGPSDPGPARHLTGKSGDARLKVDLPRATPQGHATWSARQTLPKPLSGIATAFACHAVRTPSSEVVATPSRLRVVTRVPIGATLAGLHRTCRDTLPDGVPSVT